MYTSIFVYVWACNASNCMIFMLHFMEICVGFKNKVIRRDIHARVRACVRRDVQVLQ
jgi:hypothetical protein